MLIQNISRIAFAPLFLQLLIDLSALCTGMFSLVCELGPLLCKLDPLPPLGSSFVLLLLPLYTFHHSLWVSSVILLPTRNFFLGLLFRFSNWERYCMATAMHERHYVN